MSTYTLYTGCLISRRYPWFELSARESAKRFGIELVGNGEFTCCPDPVWIRSVEKEAWLTIAARNLAVASSTGNPLAALCNGCFETLKSANWILEKNPQKREEINRRLKKTKKGYRENIDVKHLVQIIYEEVGIEKLRAELKVPLDRLIIAVHTGCHLIRPSKELGFDDPRNPVILESLVEALGAKVLNYEDKTLCCGLPVWNSDRDLSMKMAEKKLDGMVSADCIVVSCPSCYHQFEMVQTLKRDREKEIPVLYYFELLCIALGIKPDKIGLSNHRVKLDSILNKVAKQ